jgi:hypothetical protein
MHSNPHGNSSPGKHADFAGELTRGEVGYRAFGLPDGLNHIECTREDNKEQGIAIACLDQDLTSGD